MGWTFRMSKSPSKPYANTILYFVDRCPVRFVRSLTNHVTKQGSHELLNVFDALLIVHRAFDSSSAPPSRNIFEASPPLGCVAQVTDSVRDLSLLSFSKQGDERSQIAAVRRFERLNVNPSLIAVDDERKPSGAQEYEGRQNARDASVTVLKGMDLREAMMQPGGFDFGRDVFLRLMCQGASRIRRSISAATCSGRRVGVNQTVGPTFGLFGCRFSIRRAAIPRSRFAPCYRWLRLSADAASARRESL